MAPPRLLLALLALLIIASLIPAQAAALPEKYAINHERLDGLTVDTLEGANLDFNPYEVERCIVAVVFKIPAHSEVDFTLYDYGQIIPGHLNVSDDLFSRVFRWSIGNESCEFGRLKILNQVGGAFYIRTWTDSIYKDQPTGQTWVGLSEYFRGPTGVAYAPLNSAISRISLIASEPVEMKVYTVPVATYYDAVIEQSKQVIGFTDGLISIGAGAMGVITFAWGLFSRIFIENFYALIALYVSITGAVAVCTKRDIFKALELWINYQVKLLEFMLQIVDWIIAIITRIINALKPI